MLQDREGVSLQILADDNEPAMGDRSVKGNTIEPSRGDVQPERPLIGLYQGLCPHHISVSSLHHVIKKVCVEREWFGFPYIRREGIEMDMGLELPDG